MKITLSRYRRRELLEAIRPLLPESARCLIVGRHTITPRDGQGNELAPEQKEGYIEIIAPEDAILNQAAIQAVIDAHNPTESDDEERTRVSTERTEIDDIIRTLKTRFQKINQRLQRIENQLGLPPLP